MTDRYVHEVRVSIDKHPQCSLRIVPVYEHEGAPGLGYLLVETRGDTSVSYGAFATYAEAKAGLFRVIGAMLTEPTK